MKVLKIKIGLLLCLLLLGACETLVEMELPDHEPRLVVNAVFNPDSLFTVDLSASQSVFTDKAYTPVTNATVRLSQAGKHLFNLQPMGNGIYQIDAKPEPLHHYELQVSAPGYPSASSATYIPAVPVIHYLTSTKAKATQNRSAGTNVSFTLEDVSGQENYYYIQAYTPDKSYIDGLPFNRMLSLTFVSPIEDEFSMESRWFFSDKLFDGQSLQLKLFLDNNPNETSYVRVAHITKEYYNYVRSLEKQSYRDNFGVTPIPVFNNINSGLGILAGYNSVTLTVKP